MTRHRDWDSAHTDRKLRRSERTSTKRDAPASLHALSAQTKAAFHRGGRSNPLSVRGAQAMSLGNRKKVGVSLAKVSILDETER